MKSRFYSKSEIARMYFPNSSPKVAVKNLRSWLIQTTALSEALNETGYQKTQKFFTAHQVDIIFLHLGHP